jgi:hypothetical protein
MLKQRAIARRRSNLISSRCSASPRLCSPLGIRFRPFGKHPRLLELPCVRRPGRLSRRVRFPFDAKLEAARTPVVPSIRAIIVPRNDASSDGELRGGKSRTHDCPQPLRCRSLVRLAHHRQALRPLMKALRPRMTRRILRRCLRGCLKVIFVGKPLRTFPDHAVV